MQRGRCASASRWRFRRSRCYAPPALLLCLLVVSDIARALDPTPGAVALERDTRQAPLRPHVSWWIEEDRERTLDEVRAPPIAGRFQPAGDRMLNFGFIDTGVWLRFQVYNPAPKDVDGVVSVDYPVLDRVQSWVDNGREVQYLELGDLFPFEQRPISVLEHAIPIEVPAGETVTVYLRVTSKTSLTIPLFISSDRGFAEALYREQWVFGVFYGVLVAMALYAGVIYLITRQRILVPYMVFVASITMVAATLDGLAFPLWGNRFGFQQIAQYFFIHVAALGTLYFTREFVRFGASRVLSVGERLLITAHLVGLGLVLFLDPRTAGKFSLSLLLFTVVFVYAGATWRWLKDRYQPAFVYMLAFFPTILLLVLNVLVVGGVIHPEILPAYLYRFGFIMQVLLFATIQGQRMTWLQRERSSLREAAIRSEAEYKARSEFMARIGHEIRTPMNGILGMVNLLRDTQLESRQRQFLDIVHNSGVSLQGIINDLLDFAKIEAGQLELDPVDFSPDREVSDALAMFALQCERKGIALSLAMDPTVPDTLRGDNLRLRQVLVNLVGNALKFTETGSIDVHVRGEKRPEDARDWLHFEVRDSGIGIGPDVIGRLFRSFSQADASTTRRYGGTGLGLAICRQICELMGGKIWVTSKPGEGSVFSFEMPFDAPEESLGVRVWQEGLFQGLRLLLLEPRKELGGLLATEVQAIGGCLVHVESPEQLRQKLLAAREGREQAYDFVAISTAQGGQDGLQLCRQLVEQDLAKRCSLLLFTDSETHHADEELDDAGILAAFPRPFSRYRLACILEDLSDKEAACAEVPEDEAGFLREQGLRILIAEDNRVNQMVIQAFLRKLGLAAELVENGLQVLESVRGAEEPYHVVLMDCVMPEMDGYETARRLREHESQSGDKAVVIIATTAHVAPEELKRVQESGMDDWLSKPFDIRQLAECLQRWVRQRSLAD